MRFCSNCRTPMMYDPHCAKCGTSADDPIPENPKYGFGFEGAALKEHQAAALCYLAWFASGMLFLFLQPYNRSKIVRFHAQQAIVLTAAWMVIMLTVSVWVPLNYRTQSFSLMWMFGWVVHFILAILTVSRFHPSVPILGMMVRKSV